MATFIVSAFSPRLRAMAGSAVATTVESSCSMNRAQATMRGRTTGGRAALPRVGRRLTVMDEPRIGAGAATSETPGGTSVLQSAQDYEGPGVKERGTPRRRRVRPSFLPPGPAP